MKNRNKSFGESDLSFLDRVIQKLRIQKISKVLDFTNKKVVDTGCGFNASLLSGINKAYNLKSATAIDLKLNPLLREVGIDIIEQDLNIELNLENNKTDIVLSTAILEHLNNPDIYLKSIYDTLELGGELIMTVPSTYSKPVLEFLAFKLQLISKDEILDHKLYYDKDLLYNVLIQAGFKQKNIKHSYFQFGMNNFIIAKK